MKKIMINCFLVILSAILVISCKPTLNVSSDYDRAANFKLYKTFSLYYLVTNQNVSSLNEERIWNSIRSAMSKKGYVETNHSPDLVVNAFSVLKNKRYVTASSSVYGHGGAYRPYGYWNAGPAMVSGNTTFNTNNYKEGSLMIDVVDSKQNRLVWEGAGNAAFEKQPKNPEKAIGEAVVKILSSLPNVNGTW